MLCGNTVAAAPVPRLHFCQETVRVQHLGHRLQCESTWVHDLPLRWGLGVSGLGFACAFTHTRSFLCILQGLSMFATRHVCCFCAPRRRRRGSFLLFLPQEEASDRCDIRSSDVWRGKPLPLQGRTDSPLNKEKSNAKAPSFQHIPTDSSELFRHHSQLVALPSHRSPRMGELLKNILQPWTN